MKKFLMLFGALASSVAYADNSKIEVRGSIDDETSTVMDSGLITKYFSSGTRQQQTVSCDGAAFTNLTVPTGAKAVLIDVGSYSGLKLKGVTADTGISLDTACPVLLPISDDPQTTTLGIRNDLNSTAQIRVFWF